MTSVSNLNLSLMVRSLFLQLPLPPHGKMFPNTKHERTFERRSRNIKGQPCPTRSFMSEDLLLLNTLVAWQPDVRKPSRI